MTCIKCGNNLPDDSEFCQYCGTKLEIASADEKNTAASNNSVVNTEIVEENEEIIESNPIEIVEHEVSELNIVDKNAFEPASQENEETHNDEEITEGQKEKASKNLTPTCSPDKISKKTRYCKMCGGLINPETKKCTSCGKQFFKLPKFKTVLLVTICSLLLAVNVFLCIELAQAKATVTKQKKTIEQQEEQLQGKVEIRKKGTSKISFMNEHIVFIEAGEKTYHKFECVHIKNASFFLVYSIRNAEALGYEPCSRYN